MQRPLERLNNAIQKAIGKRSFRLLEFPLSHNAIENTLLVIQQRFYPYDKLPDTAHTIQAQNEIVEILEKAEKKIKGLYAIAFPKEYPFEGIEIKVREDFPGQFLFSGAKYFRPKLKTTKRSRGKYTYEVVSTFLYFHGMYEVYQSDRRRYITPSFTNTIKVMREYITIFDAEYNQKPDWSKNFDNDQENNLLTLIIDAGSDVIDELNLNRLNDPVLERGIEIFYKSNSENILKKYEKRGQLERKNKFTGKVSGNLITNYDSEL